VHPAPTSRAFGCWMRHRCALPLTPPPPLRYPP
jgi:hypothetical protein